MCILIHQYLVECRPKFNKVHAFFFLSILLSVSQHNFKIKPMTNSCRLQYEIKMKIKITDLICCLKLKASNNKKMVPCRVTGLNFITILYHTVYLCDLCVVLVMIVLPALGISECDWRSGSATQHQRNVADAKVKTRLDEVITTR